MNTRELYLEVTAATKGRMATVGQASSLSRTPPGMTGLPVYFKRGCGRLKDRGFLEVRDRQDACPTGWVPRKREEGANP